MAQNNLPSAWDDAEEIAGLDLVEKASLIGVPFLITNVYYTENNDGVSYVWVDAENAAGETFSFNDSSKGVRAQITELLTNSGRESAVESGDHVAIRVKCLKGLRVSEYDAERPNPRTGKMEWIRARTYYLTTSGKRETAAAPKAAARKAAAKPAA